MKFVLDTSAVIALLERRHPQLIEHLTAATEPPLISAATLGELAVGWSTMPNDALRRQTYQAARRLRVADIVADPMASEPSGVIEAFGICRAARIKGNDAWIGATALVNTACLLTLDDTLGARYSAIGQCVLLDPLPPLGDR